MGVPFRVDQAVQATPGYFDAALLVASSRPRRSSDNAGRSWDHPTDSDFDGDGTPDYRDSDS